MVTLGFWEQFIAQAALSLLTVLSGTVKNQIELDAINGALTFLQKLVAGNVSTT